jgi:uncharacterized UPF0160 family protein
MEKQIGSIGVHDGSFHADEVTACALLILYAGADANRIIRTRDPKLLAECEYVCDVGGIYDPAKKLFDHHQASYAGELSSAGMVLLYLKERRLISDEEYTFLNHSLILGVDAHDNGKAPQDLGYCSFSHVIANFNVPAYDFSPQESMQAYLQALDFVLGHLRRLHERFLYNAECRKFVKQAMEKSRLCLVFDRAIPWLDNFFALNGRHHPALFLIMPAGEHWKLRCIPPDYEHRMQVRLPLPKAWAGLLDKELKKISGIPGAVFCHKGGFTSVWETKQDALKALQYVLAENGIRYEEPL